ncbi:hypothetical protein SNE40_005597 [Patella caerulea]|uniref:tRNA (uracil(54)-C(5))-methyltransferase n=2 Tax=Patella caerulea TaxID=87958 RepID=A0AAN8K1S7_PATCE
MKLAWKSQTFFIYRSLIRLELSRCTVYTPANTKSRVEKLTEENQYKSLSDVVTPLEHRPYNDQLKTKEFLMRRALKKIYNIIKDHRKGSTAQLDEIANQSNGQICPFLEVKPSPVINGYRNKNSVNFGKDVNGNEKTVGYSIGRHKDQNMVFAKPYLLPNISDQHKNIIKSVQEYIGQSCFHADSSIHGIWRSAVIRSTKHGEIMLWFVLNPYSLSQEELEHAKSELKDYYSTGPGRLVGVTSLYLQVCKGFIPRLGNTETIHLSGTEYITEELNGKKFIIAPESFFQVNTPAAEVLFKTIGELLVEKSTSNLLDVGCGTGTIGILLSDYVSHVYGIDVMPSAIECAKENAKLNDTKNIEFICGMAHRTLKQMIEDNHSGLRLDNVGAILNPGRVGLNKKFIYALRSCPEVKHIIYVSCKPAGNALRNIVDLLVPEDEVIQGKCFRAEKALAVDMFPHTRHCELVISLVR